MIKIHILRTGMICVSPYVPYDDKNAKKMKVMGLTVPTEQWVWLPVSSYLIEHPKGLILVDTGWDRRISPTGEFDKKLQAMVLGSKMLARINQGLLPQGMAIDEQLQGMGYKASDIDYVIISHLDCENVSGVSQVAHARHILVSDAEMQAAMSGSTSNRIRYQSSLWQDVPMTLFQWNSDQGPFNRSYDLFGDHSVELINLPGHSDGLVAVKIINDKGKYVLLTSDSAYSTRSWREMVLPGIYSDRNNQLKSLRWVREQSLSADCIASLSTHDPEVEPHKIEL
ncbi:MAG: N-acyl homoserine lactonase family protein [Muribaculaceae bacterium]|nr:N-acyl homoserine lactonase family protein [Muribaculaceae bacterium]